MFKLIRKFYYKNISKKPRPDDYGFIAFAEKQSGDYEFTDIYRCALAQYIKSLGHPLKMDRKNKNSYAYVLADGSTIDFKQEYPELHQILVNDIMRTWESLNKKLKGYKK